jgi:hypothetical protein
MIRQLSRISIGINWGVSPRVNAYTMMQPAMLANEHINMEIAFSVGGIPSLRSSRMRSQVLPNPSAITAEEISIASPFRMISRK